MARLTRTLRAYRPDRVLWRWFTGAAYLDGTQRNDGTFTHTATRDYHPDKIVCPPQTLREEIRRDVSEIRRELRERRAQRKSGAA